MIVVMLTNSYILAYFDRFVKLIRLAKVEAYRYSENILIW